MQKYFLLNERRSVVGQRIGGNEWLDDGFPADNGTNAQAGRDILTEAAKMYDPPALGVVTIIAGIVLADFDGLKQLVRGPRAAAANVRKQA